MLHLAGLDHRQEAVTPERLQPVGVSALEVEREPQEPVDDRGAAPSEPGPAVHALRVAFGAHHHVGPVLELQDRASIEIEIPEVDLVADHELTGRRFEARA